MSLEALAKKHGTGIPEESHSLGNLLAFLAMREDINKIREENVVVLREQDHSSDKD